MRKALAVLLSHVHTAPSTFRALQLGLGRSIFTGRTVLLLMLTLSAAVWQMEWRRDE